MIIAIDGPAGAGKSTVARAVAQALGFTYLDSGAMYRCVALKAMRQGSDPAVVSQSIAIDLGEQITIDGREVTEQIRAPSVSEAASRAAADPEVRKAMVAQQRRLLEHGDWVAEGRDIGTVVAPGAELKIFLTADRSERAARRARELGVEPAAVLKDQELRDRRDMQRAHSPLEPAPGAVVIDTTALRLEEVVERVVALVDLA